MRTHLSRRIRPIAICLALLCLATIAPAAAAAGETITATAQVKTAGGVNATAPLSIVIDRFSTDAERDALMAALKQGGTASVRDLLAPRGPVGTLKLGASSTAIKYTYARTTGAGRLITVVTGSPIAYLGAGMPGAQPKTGFDLGLVILELSSSGPGHGELAPAAKIGLNAEGAVVTQDYGAEAMRLSNVTVGK